MPRNKKIQNLLKDASNLPKDKWLNELEANVVSKVIMERNKDKDFVKRAYGIGEYPESKMFTTPDPDEFGSYMTHKMSWGEDDKGQAYMFPEVLNPNNEAIKIPNQYADYITKEGYKKVTGIPIKKANGGVINGDDILNPKYYKAQASSTFVKVPNFNNIKLKEVKEEKINSKKSTVNLLSKGLIDNYPERYGKFTPDQFGSMLDSIAQVETKNKNIKQTGSGPGRGYYQLETNTIPTAIKRYDNYRKVIKEKQNIDLPEIKKPANNDARNLTKEEQGALSIANMSASYKSKLDKNKKAVPLDPTHTMESWMSYHWAGKDKYKEDRIKHWNETYPEAARPLPIKKSVKKSTGGKVSRFGLSDKFNEIFKSEYSKGGYNLDKKASKLKDSFKPKFHTVDKNVAKSKSTDFEMYMRNYQKGGRLMPTSDRPIFDLKYADGGKTKVYTDKKEFDKANQAYNDSSDVYNLSQKVQQNRFNLPEIDKNTYNAVSEKNKNLDVNRWAFDEVQYKEDKKKNKVGDFKEYMYEYPNYIKDADSYEDYQKKVREISPKFAKNYPIEDDTPSKVVKLKNGVERHYQTHKGEIIDKGWYTDVYPNGTSRSYSDYKLFDIYTPNIKPVSYKYYGEDKPREYNRYDLSSSSTGWYTEGEKPKFKNTSNESYIDYYIPTDINEIYKKPVYKPIYKEKEKPVLKKVETIESIGLKPIETNQTELELKGSIKPLSDITTSKDNKNKRIYTAAKMLEILNKPIGYINEGIGEGRQEIKKSKGGWLDNYAEGGEVLPELNSKINVANFYLNPLSKKYGISKNSDTGAFEYYLKSENSSEPTISKNTSEINNTVNSEIKEQEVKLINTEKPINTQTPIINKTIISTPTKALIKTPTKTQTPTQTQTPTKTATPTNAVSNTPNKIVTKTPTQTQAPISKQTNTTTQKPTNVNKPISTNTATKTVTTNPITTVAPKNTTIQSKPTTTVKSVPKTNTPVLNTKPIVKPIVKTNTPVKKEPSMLESIGTSISNISDDVLNTAGSIGTSISNATTALANTAEDATLWAKRAMIKQGIIDPDVSVIKAKPVVLTQPEKDTIDVKSDFQLLGDVAAQKNSKEDKYFSYYNKFDRNKGFDYVPVKNVGASDANTLYENVAGIAHFILDTDLASNTQHKYGKGYVTENLKGNPIAKGSTVKNPFVVEVNKNKNKVNIKYKRLSEVKDKSKIKVPLRQMRFTDLNWDGKTEVVFTYDDKGKKHSSFKSSVKSIPVKVAYDVYNPKTKKNEKSTSTDFIFPDVNNGKDSYGKFGGGSVVFLAEGKNFAIDFAGSVNQIKQQAEQIIKQENLKPEQLIIAYHDLGSFSAKPKARKNNTLSFYQWSDFNNLDHTGGALAIPINK